MGSFGDSGLRPPNRPRARAAWSPALVRSWISPRSNFRKRREDMENQFAAGAGGVDCAVAQRLETDLR